MTPLRRVFVLLFAVGAVPVTLSPQTTGEPRFEVASIKPASPDQRGFDIRLVGETFIVSNLSVRTMILQTAGGGFRASEILGGPDWLDTDRFEIVAKTGRLNAPAYAMLRSLLADRFKLRLHEEQRELPVYDLVVARTDGRLGPNMVPTTMDCGAAATLPAGSLRCGAVRFGTGTFSGLGFELSELVAQLMAVSERRVVDKTRLTGHFDIKLAYEVAGRPNQDVPSIFTAIQEQLGLKLESSKALVSVLVVDSVERPTGN